MDNINQKNIHSGTFTQPIEYLDYFDIHGNKNLFVFLEILIGGLLRGTIIIELYKETPKTSYNFICLCTGEKTEGKMKLHYKGNKFHRGNLDFML